MHGHEDSYDETWASHSNEYYDYGHLGCDVMYLYLFVCGPFSDIVSQIIKWHIELINEWWIGKGCRKSCPISRYCPGIHLEELKRKKKLNTWMKIVSVPAEVWTKHFLVISHKCYHQPAGLLCGTVCKIGTDISQECAASIFKDQTRITSHKIIHNLNSQCGLSSA